MTKALITKEEMLALRIEGYTFRYIASKANISNQRVQQLLSPPKQIRDYVLTKYQGYCAECGIYVGTNGHIHHGTVTNGEDYNDIENLQYLCKTCHRLKHTSPMYLKCLYCQKLIRHGKFCGQKCYQLYHTTTLVCSRCGKEFSLLASEAYWRTIRSQTGLVFCSKRCQGTWLGKNYGFRQDA